MRKTTALANEVAELRTEIAELRTLITALQATQLRDSWSFKLPRLRPLHDPFKPVTLGGPISNIAFSDDWSLTDE